MVTSRLARRESTSPRIRFPGLPPSLYPRLYYDPGRGASGQLILTGQRTETLTGSGYLLLNMLEDSKRRKLKPLQIH